jgi:hypothetical protein
MKKTYLLLALSMAIFAFVSGCRSLKEQAAGDYVIYHEPGAQPSIVRAAQELQKYIRLSTDKEPRIVNEPIYPMIALGESKESLKAGLSAKDLPWEASRIVTKKGNVYIVGKDIPGDGKTPLGGRSYGTLYGSFTFLEKVLGVRWLMPVPDEYGTLVPKHADLRIPPLDLLDQPGLEWRKLSGACTVMNSWYLHQRFDQNAPFDVPNPFPATGRSCEGGSRKVSCGHYWDELFPPRGHRFEKYFDNRDVTFDKHPDYFEMSADGKRVHPINNLSLCLSHPDIDAEVARRVNILFDNEDVSMISIFPSDYVPNCACDKCQSRLIDPDKQYFFERYPGDKGESVWSRVVFEHYQRVAALVAKKHPDKFVCGGLYAKHEAPYEGLARMPDNFFGNIAPVRLAYGPTRLDPEYNQKFHALLDDWHPYLPYMLYEGYDFWLRDYSGGPNPPYMAMMKDTFETLARLKFKGAVFHGNYGYGKSSLLNYMIAKLLWNPSLDPEAVFNDFCDSAYGEAAENVKSIYLLVDRNMTAFVQKHCKDPMGYNMYAEMLRDVYGRDWPEIEALYFKALARTKDPGCRWRIEQLGENLKLLYYHLTRLDMVKADTSSPLYMTEEHNQVLNRTKRLAPWSVPPLYDIPHIRSSLVPVTVKTDFTPLEPAKSNLYFRLQYYQEVLIVPQKDGQVTARIAPETTSPWLPDIPYYVIYDMDNRNASLQAGIADGGKTIQFQGKKGKIYLLVTAPTGRYYSGTRYGFEADAPWALGDKMRPKGLRLYAIDTPLYFYVPENMDKFDLFFNGKVNAEILDPTGRAADSVKCQNYEAKTIPCAGSPAGFWKIRFAEKATSVEVRQDARLSGYFTLDPAKPLVVNRIDSKP